jgi:flavin prenyltransferase
MDKPWVIGITGASGVVYGIKLCEFMLSVGKTVHLLITDAGWRVLHDELGWEVTRRQDTLDRYFKPESGKLIYHPIQNIGASVASGSFRTEGMIIIPCSMGTLSAIAHGASDNLLERTADVMLKEGRKLVIVPRETPLHTIHLENMLTLARMGGKIIPAMPAFYQRPQSLDELVQFIVGKVLDSIDIEHEMYIRWGESQA